MRELSVFADAKELENAARENKKDIILEKTPAFLEQWRGYKEKLAVCIVQEEKKQVEDSSVVVDSLLVLKEAMGNMDIDLADETMKELQQYQYANAVLAKMEQLAIAVVNLDTDGANGLIEELLIEV